MVSQGLQRILYGYVKIVFLANYVVGELLYKVIKSATNHNKLLLEYLECVQYGINLYFQFSGYSDVAIGFALILGFRIIENFNYPFLAVNISDFWRRWHISLSDWCRDYVYIPVAAVTRNGYVGVIVSFLVLGLWHAISFQYLVWGLYHGGGIAIWQLVQKSKKRLPKVENRFLIIISKLSGNFLTMNFVIIGFFITKEPDISTVIEKISVYFRMIF